MSRSGHVPIRTCVVCSARKPREELLRLCMAPDGCIAVDPARTTPGRGAHVCATCLPRLRLNARLRKAFRNKAGGLRTEPGFPCPREPSGGG